MPAAASNEKSEGDDSGYLLLVGAAVLAVIILAIAGIGVYMDMSMRAGTESGEEKREPNVPSPDNRAE